MRWDDDGADGGDDVDDDPDDARSDDDDDSPLREGIFPAESPRQEGVFFSLSFPSRRSGGEILRSGSTKFLGQGG